MDLFDSIIYSLNALEVHGKNNLDILLGCIIALEKLKKELNTAKEETDNGESVD